MFFKKEKEFQYHPAVIKMLEDVVGGGTIVRADLRTAIFDGMPLDELPPYCVVGKDEKLVPCAYCACAYPVYSAVSLTKRNNGRI